MPTVARSLAYTMVFDLTCLATRNAKRRSASSSAVGARLVTGFSCISSTVALSRDCTSSPPATVFAVIPARADRARAGEQQPQVLLRPTIAMPPRSHRAR